MTLNAKKFADIASTAKPRLDVGAYLESRISPAAEKGYRAAKAWVNKDDLKEAREILSEGGFTFTVVATEPNGRTQLDIGW